MGKTQTFTALPCNSKFVLLFGYNGDKDAQRQFLSQVRDEASGTNSVKSQAQLQELPSFNNQFLSILIFGGTLDQIRLHTSEANEVV